MPEANRRLFIETARAERSGSRLPGHPTGHRSLLEQSAFAPTKLNERRAVRGEYKSRE